MGSSGDSIWTADQMTGLRRRERERQFLHIVFGGVKGFARGERWNPLKARPGVLAAGARKMDVEALELPPVETVDFDFLPTVQARRTARLYFYVGFFLLPWFWCCNIWLYWPSFLGRDGDPVVKSCERAEPAPPVRSQPPATPASLLARFYCCLYAAQTLASPRCGLSSTRASSCLGCWCTS